jgi:hypothetical protein
MLTDIQLKVVVGVVLALAIGVALVLGQPLPSHLLTSFSYVATAFSIALFLWDRWLWRLRVFRPWLTTRPDLRGTWKGQLLSNWEQEDYRAGPIEVYLVVRQTFSSISARMFSLESSSASLSANIVTEDAEFHTLYIVYRNESMALLREGSPMHYGGMRLNVRGVPVQKIEGEYWTDRKTKGDVSFLLRAGTSSYDFSQAASRFEAPARNLEK